MKCAKKHSIFIDVSVNRGDIDGNLDDQRIRETIRDGYLGGSTVTIVLVGTQTLHRKHVDWEIYSSMYDGAVNKKSGILVIMLPKTNSSFICAPHGQEETRLYPNKFRRNISSRIKHKYMPARLIDNLINSDAMISVLPWNKLTPRILKKLINLAFKDRAKCNYDLHRPMRRRNS